MNTWLTRLMQGTVGLFGIGALIYGIGLMVLRAQFDLLGISGHIVWDPTQASEEGGRFLLHLIFYPFSFLVSFRWPIIAAFAVIVVARMIAARTCTDPHRWPRIAASRARDLAHKAPGVVAIVGLALVVVLLETVWSSLEPHGLLFNSGQYKDFSDADYRSTLYAHVVVRLLLAAALMWIVTRLWEVSTFFERLLIAVQSILVVLGFLLWPMAYGKLGIKPRFPMITYTQTERTAAAVTPSKGLLVTRSGTDLLVWRPQLRRLELVDRKSVGSIVVGPRQPIKLTP